MAPHTTYIHTCSQVYGPSLFEANGLSMPEYMRDRDFPKSCVEVWTRHFGFVQERTGRPIVIGEIGGRFSVKGDADWQEELISWATESEMGIIYFALVCIENTYARGTESV